MINVCAPNFYKHDKSRFEAKTSVNQVSSAEISHKIRWFVNIVNTVTRKWPHHNKKNCCDPNY